jgi:hypothetical protein
VNACLSALLWSTAHRYRRRRLACPSAAPPCDSLSCLVLYHPTRRRWPFVLSPFSLLALRIHPHLIALPHPRSVHPLFRVPFPQCISRFISIITCTSKWAMCRICLRVQAGPEPAPAGSRWMCIGWPIRQSYTPTRTRIAPRIGASSTADSTSRRERHARHSVRGKIRGCFCIVLLARNRACQPRRSVGRRAGTFHPELPKVFSWPADKERRRQNIRLESVGGGRGISALVQFNNIFTRYRCQIEKNSVRPRTPRAGGLASICEGRQRPNESAVMMAGQSDQTTPQNCFSPRSTPPPPCLAWSALASHVPLHNSHRNLVHTFG